MIDHRDYAPDAPVPWWVVVLFVALSVALFVAMVNVGAIGGP